VADSYAGDILTDIEHESRQEGVRGTNREDAIHNWAAKQPEGAHLNPSGLTQDDPVEVALGATGEPPEEMMLLAVELPDDDVPAGEGEEFQDVLRGVLKVIVHGDDDVAPGLGKPAEGGRLLAEVAR
jgi:hypothetical protein